MRRRYLCALDSGGVPALLIEMAILQRLLKKRQCLHIATVTVIRSLILQTEIEFINHAL